MLLSDKTIKEYIADGKIKIFPAINLGDVRPAGIRLHLGNELLIPIEGKTVDLDSNEDPLFEKVDISMSSFTIKSGQFILASTLEKFQVPRNIVCHLDGRSTVARIGLTVHCTSNIIDGNFEEARSVVLEMKNEGPFDIILRYKTPLALLSFTILSTDIEQKTQKQYQGQTGAAPPNFKQQKK